MLDEPPLAHAGEPDTSTSIFVPGGSLSKKWEYAAISAVL